MSKTLRRVLIVHPYGIGDLLFVTPVLRALRLIPTVEKVDLLLGSRTDIVVRHNPHVDEIFSIDKDKAHAQSSFSNLKEMLALGGKLRRNRYDLMLDYSLRREYAFWGQWVLNVPRRAGLDYRGRSLFHNIRLAIPDGFTGHHVTDDYCALAERAGIRVEDRFLEFYPQDNIRVQAEAFLKKEKAKRVIVVAPGGGESWGKDAHFKRWLPQSFAELINKLSSLIHADKVLILGTQGEKDLAREMQQKLKMPSLDLTGETTLDFTAALIEKALLFMGNDGGLVHLAHALRTPLIALYGPVDPKVYGPYPSSDRALTVALADLPCRPCYHKFRYKSDCPDRACLQRLTPEMVWDQMVKEKFLEYLK
jgi:lipopolysaccharide heptosyltransferase II